MTTLTNSEGKILNYTNEFVETIFGSDNCDSTILKEDFINAIVGGDEYSVIARCNWLFCPDHLRLKFQNYFKDEDIEKITSGEDI